MLIGDIMVGERIRSRINEFRERRGRIFKSNPGVPTKEFWKEVYPGVLKNYLRQHSKERAEELARKTTGSIWYHKMKPSTKRKYERIRRKRER